MNTLIGNNLVRNRIIVGVILALSFALLPFAANAQAQMTNSDLLETISSLSAVVQSLQAQVQELRAEVQRLQGGAAVTAPQPTLPSTVPSVSPPVTFNSVLNTSDSGASVQRLQEALIRLGFDIPAGVTGNFRAQTQRAIAQLQQEHGLPVTGVLDQATISVLNDLLAGEQADAPAPAVPAAEVAPQEAPIVTPAQPVVPEPITEEEEVSAEPAVNQRYADFYKGRHFVSCMFQYPEALATIHGWLDRGLLRYQFPWNDLRGAAADRVAACEGQTFEDTNSQSCTENATEGVCVAQSGCKWFDTFCGDQGYDPSTGGTSPTSGSGSGEMARCFYPNATINGQAPGYTVWCEADYVNCRQGDPSGPSVSTSGLSLGAPSSCDSGWSGGSSNDNAGPTQSCTGTTENACTSESNCYWKADGNYCFYDSDGVWSNADSNSQYWASVLGSLSNKLRSIQQSLGL